MRITLEKPSNFTFGGWSDHVKRGCQASPDSLSAASDPRARRERQAQPMDSQSIGGLATYWKVYLKLSIIT
jgi:hypothetical protein